MCARIEERKKRFRLCAMKCPRREEINPPKKKEEEEEEEKYGSSSNFTY